MASAEQSESSGLEHKPFQREEPNKIENPSFGTDNLGRRPTDDDDDKTEVVNRDPSFGSSLLNDNFGQRSTDDDDDDDPLKLETVETGTTESSEKGESPSQSECTLDPLLRNPNGATQVFTDMHGVSSAVEDATEAGPATTGMRHMAGLTVGAQRLGITDWGSGTDGGRSGKPQDGVPYGSFVGV